MPKWIGRLALLLISIVVSGCVGAAVLGAASAETLVTKQPDDAEQY